LRAFQWYVARHLHVINSGRFSNFNGGEFSFGHNLCFKCSNGSCEPILHIYVPRAFQWYKEILNPMGFDPYNRFLKIWKSVKTTIPKVGAHLGLWRFIPSHSPTLLGAWNVTPRLHFWLAPSQTLTLVVSSRLGSQQKTFFSFHFCLACKLFKIQTFIKM